MKDLIYSEDQDLYIDGRKLSGVSNINGSYEIPTQKNSFLGYAGPHDLIQNAPGSASFSLSRRMVTSEKVITDLLGDTGFNGGIIYNGKNMGFNSGYLSSYNVTFEVESIPSSSVSIKVFGDMGSGVSPDSSKTSQTGMFFPSSSGITVECDGRATNRVVSFSYGINVLRNPMYKIGSIFPAQVLTMPPAENVFSVQMHVDDYETKNVYDYIKTGIHRKDLKIEVKDGCESPEKKITYHLSGANLISEKLSSDVDNNTIVDLSYKFYTHEAPSITYDGW